MREAIASIPDHARDVPNRILQLDQLNGVPAAAHIPEVATLLQRRAQRPDTRLPKSLTISGNRDSPGCGYQFQRVGVCDIGSIQISELQV